MLELACVVKRDSPCPLLPFAPRVLILPVVYGRPRLFEFSRVSSGSSLIAWEQALDRRHGRGKASNMRRDEQTNDDPTPDAEDPLVGRGVVQSILVWPPDARGNANKGGGRGRKPLAGPFTRHLLGGGS